MELYAIRYGENFAYANYGTVYRGAINASEKVPGFIFLYYLAKCGDKVILFDTGFRDGATASSMGITLLDINDEISNIVFNPFRVDTIFITHSHFDHINNLDLYNESKIIISKPEYDIAMNESPIPIRSQLKSKNVTIIEGEYIFDNAFKFKVIGGHTPGSSAVFFKVGKRNFVITGDECYMRDNISRNIPNGNCTDALRNEEFISDAHHKGLIPLPYHDNSIFSNYKQISKNIIKII